MGIDRGTLSVIGFVERCCALCSSGSLFFPNLSVCKDDLLRSIRGLPHVYHRLERVELGEATVLTGVDLILLLSECG